MSAKAVPAAGAKSPRWSQVLRVLALIFSIYVVEQAVEAVLWDSGHLPGAGFIGTEHTAFRLAPECGAGCVRVEQVAPNSPLARAGVGAGDHIRFDRTWDRGRHVQRGERLGFALRRGDGWKHREVVALPRPSVDPKLSLLDVSYDVLTGSTCLFGIFILWRSRGRPTPVLLGLALILFGLIDSHPQMWEQTPSVGIFFSIINTTDYLSIFVLFAIFSITFAVEAANIRVKSLRYIFIFYTAIFYLVGYWCLNADMAVLPVYKTALSCRELLTFPLYATSLTYMYLGWKRSDQQERRRYTLMLVAFTLLVLSQFGTEFLIWIFGVEDYASNPVELGTAVVAGIVAPAMFAYAILRHKVFDLGFALNRTLVYGAVSAILLAAFGLIEWAVGHFVPIGGREKNAMVDAGFAVAVFLTFHRVRDLVEHAIEGLFFSGWQKAEKDLRRFVREAPFVTEAPALATALAEALSRFGEGASTAIYLREERGYRLVAGALEGGLTALDANLAQLVSLRADPRPLETQDGPPGAALIAPMVIRNEIIGLAMIGRKPAGDSFRPDQIELVGWAARQVGTDLHALRVEELERALQTANAQIDGMLRFRVQPV
jgi:hypothetical protein